MTDDAGLTMETWIAYLGGKDNDSRTVRCYRLTPSLEPGTCASGPTREAALEALLRHTEERIAIAQDALTEAQDDISRVAHYRQRMRE